MTASEKAWLPIEKKWGLDILSEGKITNLEMVRYHLRKLRAHRLPIDAINELEQLIGWLDKHYNQE